MKYCLPILMIFLFWSCRKEQNEAPRIRYTGYRIAAEGGRIDIKVDSVSTINELIPRLATNNELYETGKAYWIGYNDLMFSIAVHADSAIGPLLAFIDTSKCSDAKIAACYTLHLIGINCEEIGRTIEDFKNPNARKALLGLLSKEDLQIQVMELLIRDAWQSDVPILMQILQSTNDDCWPIVNGLVNYDLPGCPINQKVPVEIKELYIEIKPFLLPSKKPKLEIYKKLFSPIFRQFEEKHSSQVFIEDTLFDFDFYRELIYTGNDPITTINVDMLLNTTFQKGDYCDIGNNFQYYVVNNQIFICTQMTAKKRWLKWWESRSKQDKDSLRISKKKAYDPEAIHAKHIIDYQVPVSQPLMLQNLISISDSSSQK